MTPAKLQELARQAGAIRLIDAADAKRKTPWSLTDAALARFAALVLAASAEDGRRALAQQAGGEPASRGTIPADRRHDAGG